MDGHVSDEDNAYLVCQSRVGIKCRDMARWWVEKELTGPGQSLGDVNLAGDSDAKDGVGGQMVMQVQ